MSGLYPWSRRRIYGIRYDLGVAHYRFQLTRLIVMPPAVCCLVPCGTAEVSTSLHGTIARLPDGSGTSSKYISVV